MRRRMAWVGIATMEREVAARQAWAEDRLIMDALARRGVETRHVPWTAPADVWEGAALCVIRTVWDYTERPDDFLAWTRRMEASGVPTWNPPALVRWNAHKRYLFELEARGVPLPPTVRVPPGGADGVDLEGLLAKHGELVLKPAVDVGALNALRVRPGMVEEARAHLARITRDGEAFVQPFLRRVAEEGELSMLFFDGRFSHAVRKRPAPGDYRVQAAWGGRSGPAEPTPEERDVARRVLDALPHPTLHVRVDVVTSNEGAPVLMEVEAIEPFFFLADAPGSVERYEDAEGAHGRVSDLRGTSAFASGP